MMLIGLLAALTWSDVVWWIDVVLKVAIGLGAVIFVHELGHFLVAKACGVKIEKFMIGFDIGGLKLSWKRGETIYGIGILPLGGYVKMLGQDDDPAHIAEQMRKSQVSANSADAVEITGPNGEKYFVDRRSYLAKSVPQRMAIISAGVVMNIIFAFIFATIAYGMGVPYLPCIITETVPGSPAWQANLEPGDEIVQIGDQANPTFTQLRGSVTLGDLENGIECQVRRAADGEIIRTTLTPWQTIGRLATIGIEGPRALTIVTAFDNSPVGRAKLISSPAEQLKPGEAKLLTGDEIIRVGDVEVKDYRALSIELARRPDEPIRITVARAIENEAEQPAGSNEQASRRELEFEVPRQPQQRLGPILKMGPITAVQPDSPAALAGLKPGDVIEAVDGKRLAEGDGDLESWDAETLPAYLFRAAQEGREVAITLRRPTDHGERSDAIEVWISPEVPIQIHSPFPPRPPGAPMGADEIGIAYQIENEVVGFRTSGSTDNPPLAVGDKLLAAKVVFGKDTEGETPDPLEVDLGPERFHWPTVLDAVQFAPTGTFVELTVTGGEKPQQRIVRLEPIPVEGAFVAARGFLFEPVERIREAASLAEQLRYGWEETADGLSMVFRFLKKLGTQVPISALGGPVTIAKAAGYSAADGISSLLIFLTMLSANLAVLNFLPIPLLDGGHMVFLAYEGLRGRPANERFVVALHTVGFIFIVSLMLYVLALDLNIIDRNL